MLCRNKAAAISTVVSFCTASLSKSSLEEDGDYCGCSNGTKVIVVEDVRLLMRSLFCFRSDAI